MAICAFLSIRLRLTAVGTDSQNEGHPDCIASIIPVQPRSDMLAKWLKRADNSR
jgi:hypothetical protein